MNGLGCTMIAESDYELTDDELAFLELSRGDLEQQANVFSFDMDAFVKLVARGRLWEQVLRSHLYFDHVVTQMLLEGLKNPDAIQARRMGFAQKLDLLDALGLIRKDFLAPLKVINDLRNRLAHRLEFKVSLKIVRDLENCTPRYMREFAGKTFKKRRLTLSELLLVNLTNLEVTRQKHVFSRLKHRYEILRLRSLLKRASKIGPADF